MMHLYNPSNLKLPPLKIDQMDSRLSLIKSKDVSNFIASKMLLIKNFVDLFKILHIESNKLDDILQSIVQGEDLISLGVAMEHVKSVEFNIVAKYILSKEKKRGLSKATQDKAKRLLFQWNTLERKKLITKAKRVSGKIQNTLSKFEKEKETSLEILEITNVYFCRKCFAILSRNKFKSATCKCGHSAKTVAKTRVEPLVSFSSNLIKFIEANYWFEHGVDYLFRKLNYQTLCGVYVLGHSGVIHEIDNIAELKSSNLRMFGECKTAGIDVSDIFVFSGKMQDIGCSKGVMFTLSTDITDEAKLLARSKNIQIVENILGKPESSVLKEIGRA